MSSSSIDAAHPSADDTTGRHEAQPELRDEAMRAFITTLARLEASAPTWCAGWSAHDITAHVTGAAEERADLIEEHLAGRPSRATRSWEEREPPLRALADPLLRDRLGREAVRFETAVAALSEHAEINYTGWSMTAGQLRTHSHSEATLHRWDLVGDDDTSVRLLSDPVLVTHACTVFEAIPALAEAQRWVTASFTSGPVTLRAGGQPEVIVIPGQGLAATRPAGHSAVVELEEHELPLVLWGRCPPRLRDPRGNAESIDDILQRLTP